MMQPVTLTQDQNARLLANEEYQRLESKLLANRFSRTLICAVFMASIVCILFASYAMVNFIVYIYGALTAADWSIGPIVFVYLVAIFGVLPFVCAFGAIACLVQAIIIVLSAGGSYTTSPSDLGKNSTFTNWRAITTPSYASPVQSILLDAHPVADTPTGSVVRTLYTFSLDNRPASWSRALIDEKLFDILTVDVEARLPSLVINSNIEGAGILPHRYVDSTAIHVEGDVDKYFDIITSRGNELRVLELITPDVLWSLLLRLDTCDVEFRDNQIVFVWPMVLDSESLYLSRAQRIADFAQRINRAHEREPMPPSESPLVPLNKKQLFGSLARLIVITCILALIGGVWFSLQLRAVNPEWWPSGILLLTFILFVPSLMTVFAFAISLASYRSILQLNERLKEATRIRRYLLYYKGRT